MRRLPGSWATCPDLMCDISRPVPLQASFPSRWGVAVPRCSLRASSSACGILLVSGWKFTVSFLQNHLWRENWDPASGEDGGIQFPDVPPWPRGLRDNTHSLQHSSWHSGKGPGQEEPPGIYLESVFFQQSIPWSPSGCQEQEARVQGVTANS